MSVSVYLYRAGVSTEVDAVKAQKETLRDEWADQEEVALRLKVSKRTVEGWRLRGFGPPYCKLGKAVRYRLSAVERWADAQEVR